MGETPSAIKQGVTDALDLAVGALCVFGFKDTLSRVTFTQAMYDSHGQDLSLQRRQYSDFLLTRSICAAIVLLFHADLMPLRGESRESRKRFAKTRVAGFSRNAPRVAI